MYRSSASHVAPLVGACVPKRTPQRGRLGSAFVYVAVCATALLASCASSSGSREENASSSPLTKAAQNIERRASQAFAKNEFDSAAAGYESAALVYETLALPEPQARARLSQARAVADAGRVPQALDIVTSLLQSPAGLSPEVLTTAHGRVAALTLESDLPRAQIHLQSAVIACANTCAQVSALSVLRARAELLANQPAQAATSASTALAAAQNNNDRANALRIRAQAGAALGQYTQVLLDAQQALALDQELGLPSRVLADLVLLQRASQAQGDASAAARYSTLVRQAVAAGAALRGEAAK
jgi:tetratricopeptide (TPR) repeat protein